MSYGDPFANMQVRKVEGVRLVSLVIDANEHIEVLLLQIKHLSSLMVRVIHPELIRLRHIKEGVLKYTCVVGYKYNH